MKKTTYDLWWDTLSEDTKRYVYMFYTSALIDEMQQRRLKNDTKK